MYVKSDEEKTQLPLTDDGNHHVDEIINVSGHPQELDRQFGFWSICAISIVADNAWAAGAGTLVWLDDDIMVNPR